MLSTTKIKLMKATSHVLPVLFFVVAVVAGAMLNDYFQAEPSVSETACIETNVSRNPNEFHTFCGRIAK
jgi:uncharacterized membrane protein YoaK (UPF0700 family)